MPQDNVEIVRAIYAEWAQGRMTAGVERFAPEIRFESFMPDSDERVVAHGADEIEAFMRAFLAQWRDYRVFAKEIRDLPPDRVLVIGRQSAVGRGSGALVEDTMNSLWTLRDGSVIAVVFERDRARVLAAAGLAP